MEEQMNIPSLDVWIHHIKNPLVLAGFLFMIFALVVVNIKGKKNKIVGKGIVFLFILVLVAEIMSIFFLFVNAPKNAHTIQTSIGNNSPNIAGAKSVNIKYDNKINISAEEKPQVINNDTPSQVLKTVKKGTGAQNSTGTQSPNISGIDSVHISY
jgi:hypothetical protein